MSTVCAQSKGRWAQFRQRRENFKQEINGYHGAETGVDETCLKAEETGHFLNTYYVTDTGLGILPISLNPQENQQPGWVGISFYR